MIIDEEKEVEVDSLEDLSDAALGLIAGHKLFNSSLALRRPRYWIEHVVAMPNGKIKALIRYRFSTGP